MRDFTSKPLSVEREYSLSPAGLEPAPNLNRGCYIAALQPRFPYQLGDGDKFGRVCGLASGISRTFHIALRANRLSVSCSAPFRPMPVAHCSRNSHLC